MAAKDEATGREQGVEVSDASTLSSDEVDRMLADAKANLSRDKNDLTLQRGKRLAKFLYEDTSASSEPSPEKVEKEEILKGLETGLRTEDVRLVGDIISRCQRYYPSL